MSKKVDEYIIKWSTDNKKDADQGNKIQWDNNYNNQGQDLWYNKCYENEWIINKLKTK